MNCGHDESSPPFISYHDGPYNPSLASSASSSSASVWSDVGSQSSDDSSVHSTGLSSDAEISDSYCYTSQPSCQPITSACDQSAPTTACWSKNVLSSIAPQRRHPRRTNSGIVTLSGYPPSLIRQCDRKVNFVDSLVGKLILLPLIIGSRYSIVDLRFLRPDRRSHLAIIISGMPW